MFRPKIDMHKLIKNNIEYDQEIPQSQTADKRTVSLGRVTQQSRDTKTN